MAVDATLSPTTHPDFGLSRKAKPRVLMAQFGDGYSQRAADGINTDPLTVDATWTNLTTAEKNYLLSFFKERKGYKSFFYQYVDDIAPKVYTCPEWEHEHVSPGVYSMTAKFVQVYDL